MHPNFSECIVSISTSLLDNQEYKQGIISIIDNLEYRESAVERWELFKYKVKDFSIAFSKHNQNNIRHKIQIIEREISKIDESCSVDFNLRRKKELENELNDIYNLKSKGAQIRSRAKWINDGEQNSKYFLSLEAKNQSSNVIKELAVENNKTVHSENEILGEMCKFYEKLYNTASISDTSIDDYLEGETIPQLNNADKDFLESFPTLDECKDAVNDMKVNKSPGLDGIPSEFYKCFWESISTIFYQALKEIFEQEEMSYTQRLSVLTLLFKKGDKKLLKNYRPLSLTNTDYKIIATIFAKRLQNIICKLIDKSQSAYIKGRYIGENARLILDIFEYCENNNQDNILLFLDFEKAFDSVEWNFLFKALRKFNFGEQFLKWIKILYNSPIFRIKNK